MKNKFILLSIILLAAFLRLYQLGHIPPSLNWDEISHGYNAYSILKTGRDQWGQLLPLINFRAYGDYPLPLNLYLTLPFIAAFSLNAFAIRLPHALLGIVTVGITYLLAQELFQNIRPKEKPSVSKPHKNPTSSNLQKSRYLLHYPILIANNQRLIAFIAALLVAISPWFILPSRQVAQSNLSVFLLSAGILFFLKVINLQPANKKLTTYYLLLTTSTALLGLSLFSYHSTRIFTPLLVLSLIFIYRRQLFPRLPNHHLPFSLRLRPKLRLLPLILVFLPLPFIFLNPQSRARSDWVFLIDQGAVNRIIEHRLASDLPSPLPRLLYNRPVYFLEQATLNYLGYFSPQFLFFQGGTQYQFSLPGHSLLYPINLPFFYLGLALLIIHARNNQGHSRLLLTWLLLAPLPASVTQEKFAVLRSSLLLPLPQILTAWGVITSWQWVKTRLFTRPGIEEFKTIPDQTKPSPYLLPKLRLLIPITYFTILLISLTTYYLHLTTKYPKEYSWVWQYGYQQAVAYAKSHYQQFDQIIFTKKYGEPHEFVLFYWPWDPAKYQTDPQKVWDYHANWYWVDAFDKFRFVNDWEIIDSFSGYPSTLIPNPYHLLLITSPDNAPPNAQLLETINFLDGDPAFEIYAL